MFKKLMLVSVLVGGTMLPSASSKESEIVYQSVHGKVLGRISELASNIANGIKNKAQEVDNPDLGPNTHIIYPTLFAMAGVAAYICTTEENLERRNNQLCGLLIGGALPLVMGFYDRIPKNRKVTV